MGGFVPAQGEGWGWAVGRRSRAVGLQQGVGRSLIAQPHCPSHTHAWGGIQAGGSLQVPQSLPGQPLTPREGRMRHFCCCPRRGLARRALSCKCDAATTPPEVSEVACRARLKTGGYHGAAAAAASRVPPTHSAQAARPQSQGSVFQAVSVWDGGAAGSCRDSWRWLIVVMAQVAVPWAARGAGRAAIRGASPGTRALLSSRVPSPSLLGSPGGGSWPCTARGRRGDAHMLSASW